MVYGDPLDEGEEVKYLASLMYNMKIFCSATLITPFDLISTALCAFRTRKHIQFPDDSNPTSFIHTQYYEIKYALPLEKFNFNNQVKTQMYNLGHIKVSL